MCLSLAGTLAGDILRAAKPEYRKLRNLLLGGVAALIISFIWQLHFPINKHLWTSSFILLTTGMSFFALALFYWIIDILAFNKWSFFFYVIGLNSLTVYLAYRFINFTYSSRLLFSGIYAPASERFYPAFEAFGALILIWLFLYFLYRKKIFIKI
jgi:predicted acyltransferase